MEYDNSLTMRFLSRVGLWYTGYAHVRIEVGVHHESLENQFIHINGRQLPRHGRHDHDHAFSVALPAAGFGTDRRA